MFQYLKNYKNQVLIVLLGAILFIPFLGRVHLFDWDEINFAEAAREMIVSGNYLQVQINFQPFWEKPPLFIWMEVISMKLFGVNEFAARFPNAVCGIITLLVVFNTGRKLVNEKFAWFWVLSFIGSLLPHFYFKSGIIDPWFNLFIFSGIWFFYLHQVKSEVKSKYFFLAAIFIGLAILTKGPVALLIFMLCILVFWIMNRFRPIVSLRDILFFVLIGGSITVAWYGIIILQTGIAGFKVFITYQIRLLTTADAGHGGPIYYHWIVLLFGCFPASVFFIAGLLMKKKENDFFLLMKILFWIILILFSIVKTKIVHYSSLSYFPITFFSAYFLYQLRINEIVIKKWMSVLLFFIGGLIAFTIVLLPYVVLHKEILIPYVKDDFAIASLQANVNWSMMESGIGIIYCLLMIMSLVFIYRKKMMTAILVFFVSTIFFLQTVLIFLVPKIERYSQGTAVEFYQSLENEDCYVTTLGFKSYAHYFYSQIKASMPPDDSLLNGNINKPTYFVCKITLHEEVEKNPKLKKIKEENGFVFFRREASLREK